MVINMVLFGKFNQFDQKGRDYHAASGMDAPDSVPLQFGNAVSHILPKARYYLMEKILLKKDSQIIAGTMFPLFFKHIISLII